MTNPAQGDQVLEVVPLQLLPANLIGRVVNLHHSRSPATAAPTSVTFEHRSPDPAPVLALKKVRILHRAWIPVHEPALFRCHRTDSRLSPRRSEEHTSELQS